MEEKPKEMTPQEMAEKIGELEQALISKDTEIANLKVERDGLQTQVNTLKITGLTRQVEPISQPQVQEEVQFDFDL